MCDRHLPSIPNFDRTMWTRPKSILDDIFFKHLFSNFLFNEQINVMYSKPWTLHVIYIEHYELSVEQQMSIMLNSLPDSWECERKVLAEKASDLKYNEIVT